MKLRGEIYKDNTYIYLSMRYRNYQSYRLSQSETSDMDLRCSSCFANVHKVTGADVSLASLGPAVKFCKVSFLEPLCFILIGCWKQIRRTWENLCVFSLFWWDLYPIEAKWVPSSSQQTWPKLKDMLPMFLEPILLAQLGAAWGPWTASSVSRWVRSPKGLELRGLAFKMWGGGRGQ